MASAETLGKIKPQGLQLKIQMTNKEKFLEEREWSKPPRI